LTDPARIKTRIRALARAHGFVLCRFTRPHIPPAHQAALDVWVQHGYHGDMQWMAEPERLARRKDPSRMLADVRTVISLAMPHAPPGYTLAQARAARGRGVIAAYAHGDDYHEVMKKRLKALARALDALLGRHEQRVYVDTAPVLEHALAEQAGVGWLGKHALTLARGHGSWLLLGELFTTAELPEDGKVRAHCGSCRACLQSCPTGAIVAPYVVDARRCISYLTIEFRGMIPHALRPAIGRRVFGCDDCQHVCPWNRKCEALSDDLLHARAERRLPDLAELFLCDEDAFRARFRKSPIRRTGRAAMLRNVCIAMGNDRDARWRPLLAQALRDASPVVRAHAFWALTRLPGTTNMLRAAVARESDEAARHDMLHSLQEKESP